MPASNRRSDAGRCAIFDVPTSLECSFSNAASPSVRRSALVALVPVIALIACAYFLPRTKYFQDKVCRPLQARHKSADGSKEVIVTDYSSNLKLCERHATAYIARSNGETKCTEFFDVKRSYSERDDAPTIVWLARNEIQITINDIAPIAKSQHDVCGVTVHYHVSQQTHSELDQVLQDKQRLPAGTHSAELREVNKRYANRLRDWLKDNAE